MNIVREFLYLRVLAGALVVTPLVIAQVPTPQIGGVVNAGNYRPNVAPGELIAIFGSNLATAVAGAQSLPLPTTLGNTTVFINGTAVPLIYVSPGQVNAQVPYGLITNSLAQVMVQVESATSSNAPLTIVDFAPAIFSQSGTGVGLGAILRTNNTVMTDSNPAQPGEVIQIFATGLGATMPPVQTGHAGNGEPLANTVDVTIGGQNADVKFAGAAPGFVGVDQVNAVVPNVSAGEQPILLKIGNALSALNVTVAVASSGSSSGAIPATYFGMHLAPGFYKGTLPWPTIPFGAVRLLGDEVTWADVEPAQGQFNFTSLDAILAGAASHGVTDIMNTLVKTPTWASSNPSDSSCADPKGRPGGCQPPNDLNSDGSGTDQYWKDYVTAMVQHVCNPGPCKIQNWEIWNEPNAKNFWKGTPAQLARMTQDAYHIIKSINPNLTVVSPPPAGGGDPGSSAASYMQSLLQNGTGSSIDVIGFHGYLSPTQVRDPELLSSGLLDLAQTRLGQGASNKPLWDTEASWGLTPNLQDRDLETAFLARFYLLQATTVQRFYWYAYDYPSGTLWDLTSQTLLQPGVAYGQVYNWIVGAAPLGPCTNSGSVYSCGFTRSGGYQALAIWDSSLSCSNGSCSTMPYTVPGGYTQYRDLAGNVTPTSGGASIPISVKPILLENQNP